MGTDANNRPQQIKVLISHEVRVFRESLATLLSRWPEFSIVEMVAETEGRYHPGIASSVDLVVLDAGEDGGALAERIQQARDQFSGARVVVLGLAESEPRVLECMEAGASACTALDSSLEDLADTIRRVQRGEAVCSPKISAILFERLAALKRQLGAASDPRLNSLTQRELEILQLISSGLSNKQIASQLNLELQTVKNYVHNILEKLRVQNRREAARYAHTLPLSEAAFS